MKTNSHESERQRRLREAEERFEKLLREPCPSIRPKMMAIRVDNQIALAIERNPASLRMFADDPETGVTVMARPYAAGVGAAVLLGVAGEFNVYAIVERQS